MSVWARLAAWRTKRREAREKRRQGRVVVLLTMSPSALERYKQQLAEDDWTERRGGHK